MPTPFYEDFFERVVDVKWDTEPEVFWLVGSGGPLYINGMGSTNCCVYRSSDGKRWYGKQQYKPGGKGIGAFFGGCYMREKLENGGKPVWVLCGGSSRTVATSCAGYSTDGEIFGDHDRIAFDEVHLCEEMYAGNAEVIMYSENTMGQYVHYDAFRSPDGKKWQPDNYHGAETGLSPSPAAAPAAAPTLLAARNEIIPVRKPSIIRAVDADANILRAPEASARTASTFAEVTPFAPGDTQQRADEIVFNPSANRATGKVRKGPFRGKRLTISIDPYHNPQGGGAHGDNTVRVYVHNKEAVTDLGKFDCQVARTMAVGYGHYTFVVTGSGGSNTQGQLSTIAWSEDGVRWRRVDLGRYGQINAIAVGPRPSDAPPRPPGADEITTGGKTVSGQTPTMPTS